MIAIRERKIYLHNCSFHLVLYYEYVFTSTCSHNWSRCFGCYTCSHFFPSLLFIYSFIFSLALSIILVSSSDVKAMSCSEKLHQYNKRGRCGKTMANAVTYSFLIFLYSNVSGNFSTGCDVINRWIIGIRKKYQALLEYGAPLQRTFATVWQDTGEYVDVRSSILFLNISLFEQKNIIFLVF